MESKNLKEIQHIISINIDIIEPEKEEINLENDIYNIWLSVNYEKLRDDFIIEKEKEFEDYCQTIFKTLHRKTQTNTKYRR